MFKKVPLWQQIIVGMVIGIAIGLLTPKFGAQLKPLGDAFIRAIRMIVVPLVFTAILLAVVKVGGDIRKFGRMVAKSLFWFFVATSFAVILGIALNDIFHPAAGVTLKATGEIPKNLQTSVNWVQFFLDIIPTNVVEAAAGGKILPIIFFAVTFGIALGNIGEKAQVVIAFFDAVFQALFKLTAGIIAFAPIGVAGVMAWVLATQGLNVLFGLAKMVGVLYLGLAIMLGIFWVFLQFFTAINPQQMFKKILEPFLLAFVTTSSEVTLPVHMKILEENGVPNRIASFVLPLGYTFNLDGSTLYQALAFSFLTEAYGIEMSLATKGAIFVTILIASKGTASVPAASLVVLATVLTSLGMPLDGIAVLIGVDRFMDMGRTGFNVIGNSVAAIMVAKWEGVLGKTEEELLAMEEQQLIAKQQHLQA